MSSTVIPTEPIGSIPRGPRLIDAGRDLSAGRITSGDYAGIADAAVQETIEQLEATGSPLITDGEQGKPSFATYPLAGLEALAPDGVVIPFADGHTRQLPRLTAGPFRYASHADGYLELARRYAHVPVKQAVIAASALSLLYPQGGIDGYPREAFLADLVREAVADIRGALDKGAHSVQIDFTEGRLAVKLDPSGQLLQSFIDLNNQVLARFSPEERQRIFVGVTDPINPRMETAEQVRDRVLEAAEYIEPGRLGTCDDCGFAPFGDDTSTARETAFAKIRSRVAGTQLAASALGL